MAINKRKILDSAQKHLQKGALEKALKDYETLLKADPKDANCRLKIGDIQLKRGKPDEAIAAYIKVAESFMKNGFDAKAVALYKQITKIDEKRVDVFVPLAELYERMGLHSDALKVLQQAADAHYREGDKDQALDLLRRMAALDPSNTSNRIKVADLLRQGERSSEAIAEYEAVAEELARQGAEEDRIRILVRILELDPTRTELMASVGRSRLESGNFEAAEKTARMMIERGNDDPEAWLLLGEACDGLGRDDAKVDAYRRAAEIFRERGEEDRARDLTQRFVVPAELERSTPDTDIADDALLGSEVEDLGGQSSEESDPGFDPNAMNIGRPIADFGAESPAEPVAAEAPLPPLPPVSRPGAQQAPVSSEGDPEQLLAEASVYLRYGKHDRAIESLRAIVAHAPGHALACMKLADALKATNQIEEAIDAYTQAARAARASADMGVLDVATEALAALAPDRAVALDAVSVPDPAFDAAAPEPASVAEPELDLEAPMDVDLDDGLDLGATDEVLSEPAKPQPEIELDGIEFDDDLDDIEDAPAAGLDGVELEFDEEPVAQPTATTPPSPFATNEPDLEAGGDLDLDDAPSGLPEIELDVPDIELSEPEAVGFEVPEPEVAELGALELEDVELPGAELASAPELPLLDEELDDAADDLEIESPSAASMTTPAQVAEDLEEADFFFQQGMLDEAKAVYDRILATAPNHPQALLRVGEIGAARPAEAASVVELDAASPEVEQSNVELTDEDLIGDDLFDADADLTLGPDPDEEPTDRLQVEAPRVEIGFASAEDEEPEPPRDQVALDAMAVDPLGVDEIAASRANADLLESEEDLGGLEIDLGADSGGQGVEEPELEMPGLGDELGVDALLAIDDAPAVDDHLAIDDAPAVDDDLAVEEGLGVEDGLGMDDGLGVDDDLRVDADRAVDADVGLDTEVPAEDAGQPPLAEDNAATLDALGDEESDTDVVSEALSPPVEADITARVVELVPPDLDEDLETQADSVVTQDPDDASVRLSASAEDALADVPTVDALPTPVSPSEQPAALDVEAELAAPDTGPIRPGPIDSTPMEQAPTAHSGSEDHPAAAGLSDDAFDLAAQLSDVFDLEDPAPGSAAAGSGDEGFEQVFAAFKQGVEGALDESDFEAHYDLGIAYREMGLVEDAISEFNAAMGAPERTLACLHMMGLCALDLARTPDAVANLEQALALPDVPSDQQMAIRFDLGRAYAADGDTVRARAAFESVQAEDPRFQDVGDQLAALDALPPEDGAPVDGEAGEAFENFDDLMSGEVYGDEAEVAPEPQYESFDEFMDADDESDEMESEDEADEEPAVEGVDDEQPEAAQSSGADMTEDVPDQEAEGDESDDPEPSEEQTAADSSAESDPEPPKRGRRKNKISFV